MRTKKVRLIPIEEDKAEVTGIEFFKEHICLKGRVKSIGKSVWMILGYDKRQVQEYLYNAPFRKYLYIALPIMDDGYYLVIIPALYRNKVDEAVKNFENVFDSYEAASIYMEERKTSISQQINKEE